MERAVCSIHEQTNVRNPIRHITRAIEVHRALSGDLESRVTTQYVRTVDDECDEVLGDV